MSRLFRSFSFAFFPEDPSTIGIRVTWNKHQKLVRSPHSSRTSFSHWMQKACNKPFTPQFPLQVHTELCFHFFKAYLAISGRRKHILRSRITEWLHNCQHARRCFARTSPNFKNGQAFLSARIFAGWNTDVGISHGISVNFLPVTWETSPPQKKNQRRKHWPFEWTLLWSGWNWGLDNGHLLKLPCIWKKSPSRRCKGFISKKTSWKQRPVLLMRDPHAISLDFNFNHHHRHHQHHHHLLEICPGCNVQQWA